MYYKIINKECEVYRALLTIRRHEIFTDKMNLDFIERLITIPFSDFFGCKRQQTRIRTKTYRGFLFTDEKVICPKTWRKHKDFEHIYVPNNRYIEGRKMHDSLFSLPHGDAALILKALGIDFLGEFSAPFLEICDDEVLILYIGNNNTPSDENVIEITRVEFHALLSNVKIES